MARNRGRRSLVFVTIGSIKYGFAAGQASSTYRSALGQTVYASQAGVVFGANSPKPNRASRLSSSFQTISSYCDPSVEDTLRASPDWSVTLNSRRRGLSASARTRSVYVEMPGGYKYAWNLTIAELSLASELGFAVATGSMSDLVWGSTPKPPRATKKEGGITTSTFIKPQLSVITAAITDGWTISGINYDLIPDV